MSAFAHPAKTAERMGQVARTDSSAPCPLDENEWNFSRERVPDRELVGCCYWEYARESPFVRDLRRRCLESRRLGWKPDDALVNDIDKLQSIGEQAEVILRGFYLEPDIEYQSNDENLPTYRHPDAAPITGSFPLAWQSLSAQEREYRSRVAIHGQSIFREPIKRGESFEAQDIADHVEKRRREIFAPYEDVRRKYPTTSEVELIKSGLLKPFPGICASMLWESGREAAIVAIQWSDYTDDELARYFRKWLKENRPEQFPAPNDKGRKVNDRRVALNRLGIMRALHTLTLADVRFPKVFKDRGEKYCYGARKLVLKKLVELFPFLPREEKPISWMTKGRRST